MLATRAVPQRHVCRPFGDNQCSHLLTVWRDEREFATIVQHGDNHEARRSFPDRIVMRFVIEDWLDEVHAYEESRAGD